MSVEYPLLQNLLMRFDVDIIRGQANILPNYEYNPSRKVVSVNIYSKDMRYLMSLVKGMNPYIGNQLTVSKHQLPMFSYSDATFFSQVPHIYSVIINSSDIHKLCGIFGLNYEFVYRECEPKPKLQSI